MKGVNKTAINLDVSIKWYKISSIIFDCGSSLNTLNGSVRSIYLFACLANSTTISSASATLNHP